MIRFYQNIDSVKIPIDFWVSIVYTLFMGFKSEVKIVPDKKKMGRPTDSPKTTQFSVRFDEETIEILDEYCNQENVSRPEGVRRAVRKLKKQQ